MKWNEKAETRRSPCCTKTATLQELGQAFGPDLNEALDQPGAKAAVLAVDREADGVLKAAARVTFFTEENLRDPKNPVPKKLRDEALKDPPRGFGWAFICTSTDGTHLAKISRQAVDFNAPLEKLVQDFGGVLAEKLKAGAEVAVLLVDRGDGATQCHGLAIAALKPWLLEGMPPGPAQNDFGAHVDHAILPTLARARADCPPGHGCVMVITITGGLLVGLLGLEPGPCKVVGCSGHAAQN